MAFWEDKGLEEMSQAEWESLCDGCARCCMIKIEDEDDGAVYYTGLVCHLLDIDACRCTRYSERHEVVRDCIKFTADLAGQLKWLPLSCAYRRLAEGRALADWHPLISGDPGSVYAAGISVRDRVIPVQHIHEEDLPDHVVDWVET